MCGLMAAWDPNGLDGAPLSEALADLRHRGPDAQATVWRDDRRLHLAHTRLKIIDVSDAANQPFVSVCGRWALIFNGEIYNFRELRQQIGDQWRWRTRSDSEVLLAAWSVWDRQCLDKLVGMFAFAIHDAESQRLTLARDRFGIKPLYHAAIGQRHVFASEIPPLLRFLPAVVPDHSTIRTYLELGLYDHGRETFFKEVEAIEPGCLAEVDLRDGSFHTDRWYDLFDHVTDVSGISDAELADHSDVLLKEAVRSHLIADVGVGLNVSGGVDSSMLVRTTVAELGHAHLFTQDYEGYSELPWVHEVSHGGTLHVAQLDLPRIQGYLPGTVKSEAEPFGGVFVCGYNALYEMARDEDITVLLDGNGLDEIFLGYKRYHQLHVANAPSPMEQARRAEQFESAWGEKPRRVSPGSSIDGTHGLCPGPIAPSLRQWDLRPVPSCGDCAEPVREAAAADLLRTKIPRNMRFNDRVSMAHSRELRVPFLDHRLVEFAFGIPVDRLLTARGGKAPLRDLLARRAPKSLAYAAKRSVQSPQREWLAGPWRPLVESVLRSDTFAARGWIDPVAALDTYDRYRRGSQENSFFLWQWLNLELWARCYLDRSVES